MSKPKQEVVKAIEDWRALVKELDAQRALIDLDDRAKDEVKAQERRAAMLDRADRAREIRVRAVGAAEKMKADLQARYRRESAERLMDGGYQAALNATANALKSGAVTNSADLEAVAQVFGNDPMALSVLRPAAAEHGLTIKGKEDTRGKNIEQLEGIRAGLDTYLDSPYWFKDDWRAYAGHALDDIAGYLSNTDEDGAR